MVEIFQLACLAMIWVGWCYVLAMRMSKDFGMDPVDYIFCILIGAVCTVGTLFGLAALYECPVVVIGLAVTLYGCYRATRMGVETSEKRRGR